jgi:hypothetical protein
MRSTKIVKHALAVAGGLVLVMGLLHTRLGRPLLARLSGSAGGGCPVGLANATPEKLEEGRVAGLKSVQRGSTDAPARPALKFTVGATARADVSAWADAAGITCKDALAGTALRCLDVDPNTAGDLDTPRIADLFFRFDPKGTLVALDAMHADAPADDAVHALASAEARLARDLGPATSTDGERTAAYLDGAMAQASIAYRFRDYAIDVSATNFGNGGVVVREQYRALEP